jgi:thymidylate synthase
VRYPLQKSAVPTNQLETMIASLRNEHARGGLKHAFELQVFAPGLDIRPMGFPCMSSLSLQVDGPRLHLTATYRNQYYIQKALGNFVGLAGLHTWIAVEAGLDVGRLTVHAFHAQIDPRVTLAELAYLQGRLPDTNQEA